MTMPFLSRRALTGTCAACALSLLLSQGAGAAPQYDPSWHCQVYASWQNTERYMDGAPSVECGFPHSPPWGNWGVTSNVGPRYDGYQFTGWHPSDGWYQWNSCFTNYHPPNSSYYNANGGFSQENDPATVNTYGNATFSDWWVSAPSEGYDSGGCFDIEGVQFGSSNNYMSLYELDPWDDDEFVQTLYFPNPMYAVLACGSPDYCGGASGWQSPASRSYHATVVVNALIRMAVGTELSYY